MRKLGKGFEMTSIKIDDPISVGIHEYIEKINNREHGGMCCLFFPDLPQRVVDEIGEDIEAILEYHLGTKVLVDD